MAAKSTARRGSKGGRGGPQKHGVDVLPKAQWDDWMPPWACLAGLLILGAASHALWPGVVHDDPLGYLTPLALLAGFFGLGWNTARYTTPRGKVIHQHLFASLIAAGVMTAWLAVTGLPLHFWEAEQFWILFIPGFFVALSWNMPRTRAVHGEGKDTHKESELEKVGLHPSTVIKPSRTVPGEIVVEHKDGEDTSVLQAALVKIESMRKLSAGTLTAVIGKHRGQSVIRAIDPGSLDKPVMYPGPSRSGGSISEPLRTGQYADGEPLESVQVNHGLTMGLTDAGKTFEAFYRITEMMTRRDIVNWWNDPIKGMQSAGPLLAGLDWAAQDETEAKAMLRGLLAAIPARTNELGRLGYTKWTPQVYKKHGIPKLHVQFEEAAWLMESGALVKVAERARSAGIEFDISLQRASHDRMDTSVRSMLARRTCFGVMAAADAEFCLRSETIDAGASPHLWGDTKKGALYREAGDIKTHRWSIPARSFALPAKPGDPKEFDATILTRVIEEHASIRAELDPVTVAALGPAYANRHRPGPPTVNLAGPAAKAGVGGQAAGQVTVQPADSVNPAAGVAVMDRTTGDGHDFDPDPGGPDDVDDDDFSDSEWSDEDLDEDMGLVMVDPDPEVDLSDIDPLEEIPDAPTEVDFEDSDEPVLPTEERNERFRELCQAYLDRGQALVSQAELARVWSEIPGAGGRPWPYMRLHALAREGLAERDDGDPRFWLLHAGAGARTVTVGDDDE